MSIFHVIFVYATALIALVAVFHSIYSVIRTYCQIAMSRQRDAIVDKYLFGIGQDTNTETFKDDELEMAWMIIKLWDKWNHEMPIVAYVLFKTGFFDCYNMLNNMINQSFDVAEE